MAKVYCAGPLFNLPEKAEMGEIASALEVAGFTTFLPQRDGIELANLRAYLRGDDRLTAANLDEVIARAIFALDISQLASSDAVVVNLNGRVPDEGAIVEAGVGWTLNKAVVLYKSDARSLFNGADNPMISGLGKFALVSEISKLPLAVEERLNETRARQDFGETVTIGQEISRMSLKNPVEVSNVLAAIFGQPAGESGHERSGAIHSADPGPIFSAARSGSKASR
jgi:nucleoside 2-deoxyribosyltransferase